MANPNEISEKIQAGEKVSDSEIKELMSTPNIEPKTAITRQEEDQGSEAEEKEDLVSEEPESLEKPSEDVSKKESAKTSEAKEETDDTKKEEPAVTAEQKEADLRKKLEAELDKPYGEEDLSDYSTRERALFFEMRRERRKRQEAQEELDLFKFRDLKKKAEAIPDNSKKEEQSDDAPEDPFSGRDEEEFLTVGDVKKILSKQSTAAGKNASPEIKQHLQALQDQNIKLLQRTWFLEGQQKHDDFMEVLDLAPSLLEGDKKAEEEIQETAKRGGNPALTTYNLVKAHQKYKESNKEESEDSKISEQRAKKIEANSKKPRTTGAGGGSSSSEYSLEDLVNMSDEDFSKINPEKRKKLLQFYS